MIVVTGAAGFISSCLVGKLNAEGYNNIVLVDDFSKQERESNYINKKYVELVDRNQFENWLDNNQAMVEFIFHLGARTDTAEFSVELFNELNLNYSKMVWNKCVEYSIPMVYASSGATYGLGEKGYSDQTSPEELKPLNPYGDSKNDFDKWVFKQEQKPPFWAGVKFFNVYGPNEYHKGRMASVIFHTFNQIQATGGMKLFASHNPKYKDGEQMRDFVYVKDLVNVLFWMMEDRKTSGLFNIGAGHARTFKDLAENTFRAMGLEPNISYIPTPEDIRDKYQYFTEADITALKKAGYPHDLTQLEEGVKDYVQNYLMKNEYY